MHRVIEAVYGHLLTVYMSLGSICESIGNVIEELKKIGKDIDTSLDASPSYDAVAEFFGKQPSVGELVRDYRNAVLYALSERRRRKLENLKR